MSSKFGCCTLLLAAITLSNANAATQPAAQTQFSRSTGLAAEFAYETSDFLKQYEYPSPETMFLNVTPSGAYAANKDFDEGRSKRWFIEEQRWGRDLILAGIARHQTSPIDRGLLMLAWGFRHQNKDGSFPCPDSYHSTSFFVDAVADSILMLRASEYATAYKTKIDTMVPGLRAAALWMLRPEVTAAAFQGPMSEAPYTHRRYLVAAALGETGLITGDETLLVAAAKSARAGIAMQDSSGYNPEKGGYDSSYHAVGVVFAERYYTLACPPELRPALYEAIRKAVDWAASRLNPDATMNLTGNTRVSGHPENNRNGVPKQPSYRGTFRLLYRWSMLSGDNNYEDMARRVARAAPASSMPAYLPTK
jgi:hypothetical protein